MGPQKVDSNPWGRIVAHCGVMALRIWISNMWGVRRIYNMVWLVDFLKFGGGNLAIYSPGNRRMVRFQWNLTF